MSEDEGDLDAVLAAVRERVTPDAAERERMREVVAELTDRAEAAVADLPVDATVTRVGSTARGTWLAGDRDVDLFVQFQPTTDRQRLEEYGLQVGNAVLPEGKEEYAEHPYVSGSYRGFDVDLVPCYDVDDASEIRTSVDRTPFHNAYLDERLDEALADEIRIFKRFLKGIDVYGSDLRTRGFSGYLAELLVVEYGSVGDLLAAAADWQPPVELDPAEHRAETFQDFLVVVDPTDPARNVAAVLSAGNLARFQHHARDLLGSPREAVFFPPDREPLNADDVRDHVRERGTTPLAVVFDAPDIVDDQLYPQLRRSLAGVVGELERRGFGVVRSTALADERAVLLVEPRVDRLPAVERHEGPPVHVREHAEGFYGTYADDEAVYGPFVDGDRYVVERERDHRTPASLLRSDDLFDVALGTHVESTLRESGYEILVGEEVATLAEEFGNELRDYFDPAV